MLTQTMLVLLQACKHITKGFTHTCTNICSNPLQITEVLNKSWNLKENIFDKR